MVQDPESGSRFPLDHIDMDDFKVGIERLRDQYLDGDVTVSRRFLDDAEQMHAYACWLYTAIMRVVQVVGRVRHAWTEDADVEKYADYFDNTMTGGQLRQVQRKLQSTTQTLEEVKAQAIAAEQTVRQQQQRIAVVQAALQEIVKWSADPRVRDEAGRLVQRLNTQE